MAEQKTADTKAAAGTAAGKKGGGIGFILLMIVIGALVPFIYPSLFLFVGMLPTAVAMFTVNDKQGAWITAIGALNAAGITPFIIELWQKGQTMDNALRIMGTSETWLIMFGAAGVGQLILFAVPQAITSLTLARAEARIQLLKSHLDILKAAWGPDVATTKPLEKVIKGE
ncbi:MAG: hypothetical protein AB7H77_08250 [Bdellovibrionales bacterium]